MCEGLQEKLEQLHTLDFELEIRDITTREDWFQAYQYEIPVLILQKDEGERIKDKSQDSLSFSPHPLALTPLPRLSPRASVQQVEQMLQKFGVKNRSE